MPHDAPRLDRYYGRGRESTPPAIIALHRGELRDAESLHTDVAGAARAPRLRATHVVETRRADTSSLRRRSRAEEPGATIVLRQRPGAIAPAPPAPTSASTPPAPVVIISFSALRRDVVPAIAFVASSNAKSFNRSPSSAAWHRGSLRSTERPPAPPCFCSSPLAQVRESRPDLSQLLRPSFRPRQSGKRRGREDPVLLRNPPARLDHHGELEVVLRCFGAVAADVAEIARTAIGSAQPAAAAKSLTLNIDSPSSAVTFADASRIGQVFDNDRKRRQVHAARRQHRRLGALRERRHRRERRRQRL